MAGAESDLLVSINICAKSLGYQSSMLFQDDGYPFDMCIIPVEDKNDLEEKEHNALIVTIYPMSDELDGSVFVQFYAQYYGKYDQNKISELLETIAEVNAPTVLGHFNILKGQQSIYYKYVLAIQNDQKVTEENLNDILDMCMFAFESNQARFEAFLLS